MIPKPTRTKNKHGIRPRLELAVLDFFDPDGLNLANLQV